MSMSAPSVAELPSSWLHREPASWGGVGTWRNPDEGQAFLIEGYATDDGKTWSEPLFPANRLDVTLAVLDMELAQQAYALVSRFLSGASVRRACLDQESEHVCALWRLNDQHAVVLVGDADGRVAQEEFDKVLNYLRVPFASTGQIAQYRHFNGAIDSQLDEAFHAELSGLAMNPPAAGPRRRR